MRTWVTLRHDSKNISLVEENQGSLPRLLQELTPQEARRLALGLLRRADEIDG